MKKIAVIGAGFSGLSLAYLLKRNGFSVEVFEKKTCVGGLIQSEKSEMLVESAAHAFLATENIEKLFEDLKVPYVVGGYVSSKKWIFRKKPCSWPLSLFESLKALKFIFRIPEARPSQSLEAWILENLNTSFNDYLIGPALQGVYGVQPKDLSAQLIFRSLKHKSKTGRHKGSLAPLNGMSQIMNRLAEDQTIHFNSDFELSYFQNHFDGVVLATGFYQAAEILKNTAPLVANAIQNHKPAKHWATDRIDDLQKKFLP